MNDILLTGAVAIVTASAIWDFIKFIINRKDGKETELKGIKSAIDNALEENKLNPQSCHCFINDHLGEKKRR